MSATVPKIPYATAHRTHTCGELRKAHVGQQVKLCGALDKVVDDTTYDLRDHYGRTRVRLTPAAIKTMEADIGDGEAGSRPSLESMLKVTGKVVARPSPDPDLATGEVMVEATGFEALNQAKTPVLFDFRDDSLPRVERIRHRYLYLKKPAMHENLAFRTRVQHAIRRLLVSKGFEEVETPLLANRWSPEQTEAYLAIRGRKEIFALPGRRTIHGPVLMASGYDRTFELARRFSRKPAYNPYQQPEYTVLEAMTAFVDEAGLHALEDAVLARVWKEALGEELSTPIPEFTYDDAMVSFGTDAPDLRNPLFFQDVTRVAAQSKLPEIRRVLLGGGAIRALVLPKAGPQLKDEHLGDLGKCAGEAKFAALGWITQTADGLVSKFFESKDVPVEGFGKTKAPGYAVSELGPFDDALARDVVTAVAAKSGDMVVVALAEDRNSVAAVQGAARRFLGETLALAAKRFAPVRITRLPYFRHDSEVGWILHGDPRTLPVEEEVEGDPRQMHGYAHYLVLNGLNIGGGSVRNHNMFRQKELLSILGLSEKDIDERFEQYLGVMRFGVPPHGRIGIGIERLVALLRGLSSIDDVMAMAKTPEGMDPQTRSPWPIDPHVVSGLFGL